MRHQDFSTLTPEQQISLLIAMHVRNEMEDFHIENLSDTQMKQLNPIIRQAIFDIVSLTNTPPVKKSDKKRADQTLEWLIRMIPDYWEIPEKMTADFGQSDSAKRKSENT